MDTIYRAQVSILMWLDCFCANKSFPFFLQEEVRLEQIEHVHCKPDRLCVPESTLDKHWLACI